ncbi:MAG TPA: hypothetical protein VM734_28225 [Kofleriaceae bacterium]|nr:hypothetical protein [Kofleriaceae bacterium]
MRRISRLTYSLLTASALHLAACGGDAADQASFASATQAQRERAIVAGTGADSMIATLIASSAAAVPPGTPSCPKVETSDNTVTVSGGCTTSDGEKVSGRFTGTNLPPLFGAGSGYDPTKPTEVAFDGYLLDSAGTEDDLAIDGTVTMHPDERVIVDLRVSLGGLEAISRGTWKSAGESTTVEAGTTIEVTGVGEAEVQGTWNMDGDFSSGALELHGADVLKVDIAAMVDGCAPITIDGKAAGQICNDSDDDVE